MTQLERFSMLCDENLLKIPADKASFQVTKAS